MALEFKEEYLEDITKNMEQCKSNTRRINDLEDDVKSLKSKNEILYKLTASIENLTDGIGNIQEDVKEIKHEQGNMKTEIQEIKNAPIKTKASIFDGVWKYVATAFGGGLFMYLLTQIFPAIFK